MNGDCRLFIRPPVAVTHRDLIDEFCFRGPGETFQFDDVGRIQHQKAPQAVIGAGQFQHEAARARMHVQRAVDVPENFGDEFFQWLLTLPEEGEAVLFCCQGIGGALETAAVDFTGGIAQTPGGIVQALIDDVCRVGIAVDVATPQRRGDRNAPGLDAPGFDVRIHRREQALLDDEREHPAKRRNDAPELLLQVAGNGLIRAAHFDVDGALHPTLAGVSAKERRRVEINGLRSCDLTTPGCPLADDDARDRIDRAMTDRQMEPGVIAMANDV